MSEIELAERILKALKNDHKNGRIETSVYLRLMNSYETVLRQARKEEVKENDRLRGE